MAWRREPKPFWRSQTSCWYVQIGDLQHRLSANDDEAAIMYHRLMVQHLESGPRDLRIKVLLEEFLADIDVSEETRGWYRNLLRRLPKIMLPDLDIEAARKYVAAVPGGVHNKRGAIGAIRRFLKWCAKRGYPVCDISDLKMPAYQPSDRHLSDEEWAKVEAACPDDLRPILTFLWLTGCRPGEARKLQAKHWDAANGCYVLQVSESKGKKRRRVIYPTPEARALCCNEGHCFVTKGGRPWGAPYFGACVKSVAVNSGVEFDARSLRHSFVSRALRKGVAAETLRRLVGHVNTTMIDMVYGHIDDGQLLRAARSINSPVEPVVPVPD